MSQAGDDLRTEHVAYSRGEQQHRRRNLEQLMRRIKSGEKLYHGKALSNAHPQMHTRILV